MNGPQAYRAQNNSAVGLVIKRFTSDERIEEILKQNVEKPRSPMRPLTTPC